MNAHNAENLAFFIQSTYREPDHKKKIGEMISSWGISRNNTEGVWFVGDSHYKNQGYYPCWYVNRGGKTTWWERTSYDWVKGIAQLKIYSVKNGKISPDYANYEQFDYTDSKYADDPRFDFYHGARRRGGTYFSIPMNTPWVDYSVLTVSTPVYNDKKELMGVVGIDMDTSDIQKIAADIKMGETSYAIFLTDNGSIIYHPNKELMLKKNIFADYDDKLTPYFKNAIANDHLWQEVNNRGNKEYFFSVRVPSTKWTIVLIVPSAEILGSLNSFLASIPDEYLLTQLPADFY